MRAVYALENLPDPCYASLFLAGPAPLNVIPSWRPKALDVLAELGYTGAVIIPEPRSGEWCRSYSDQANWEIEMRSRSDLIVFWVPRKVVAMAAFTSNIEFGEVYDSCRFLYGRPPESPKCRYLDACWETVTGRAPHESLGTVLAEAVALLGDGAERHGAERDVPLAIWRSQPFATWYAALTNAGHELRGFQLRDTLPLGKRHPTSPLFGFLAWAAVAVAGENRVKANEVFVARSNTVAVVPLFDVGGPEGEAFLVREYRLAAKNPSGFVVEVPGGSSRDARLPPRAIAVEELGEEVGLVVAPKRLLDLGARQSAPTLCSHHTHLFALELTAREASRLRQLADEGRVLGADREERIRIIRQPLTSSFDLSLDWASIGLLTIAMAALTSRAR